MVFIQGLMVGLTYDDNANTTNSAGILCPCHSKSSDSNLTILFIRICVDTHLERVRRGDGSSWPCKSTITTFIWKNNKIRDLFKVKLYTVRSETEKKEREREKKREKRREKRERE